jgi:copper resistance protein B
MKAWFLVFLMLICPANALGAEESLTGPGEQGFASDYHKMDMQPGGGNGIPKYAHDAQPGAQKNFGRQPVHDNEIFYTFQGDRLEYQTKEGNDVLLWDVQAWAGTDYDKLYLKSEGTRLNDEDDFEELEVELLYSRNIATFWDLQAGIRHDFEPHPTRTFAALGFQGMAPYWFEVDTTAYVSEDGDVSAALEIEYDILLSQRLIFQPRFETSIAVQEVEEYTVGQGINSIELGARLRYEIRREFAPYIGISWHRKIAETQNLAEKEGEDTNVTSFVIGTKMWF